MRTNFLLLLLLCITAVSCRTAVTRKTQTEQPIPLNIGDPAPPLLIRKWVKGSPVKKFAKGKVYVVEFWATWCAPCRAEMPHLSALAREYKDQITFLSMNIHEDQTPTAKKVKAFVDSMGTRMDYRVAVADSSFMATKWRNDLGVSGLPGAFVVNREGRIAWIGHPTDLGKVLPMMVNKTWNMKEASNKQNSERYLAKLDEDAYYELANYWGDPLKPDDLGKPDSALLLINKIVEKEPQVKYAPQISYQTFASLLKTNPGKAYEYGKEVMQASTFEYPYDAIVGAVKILSDKLTLPAEIYQLGAEAQQAEIDEMPYPENINFSTRYNQMAAWYSRANNKSKAIEAQEKAIEALKAKKDVSATDIAAFESRLQQYKNMSLELKSF